jgi:hypothetical protein
MRLLPRRILLGAAVAVAGVASISGVLAPVAFADPGSPSPSSSVPASGQSSGLAKIKAKATSAIARRDSALHTAIQAVGSNHYLTPPDRSTALATLNGDLSGIDTLAPIIQADTTVVKARADYDSLFTSYRVFALALPQARLAASADDLTGTVLPRLTDAQSRLEALLSGTDQDKDSASVQAAMADLGRQISVITSTTNGASTTVLGYKPADWNSNHELLAPVRADLTTARADAKQARADIRTVVTALE